MKKGKKERKKERKKNMNAKPPCRVCQKTHYRKIKNGICAGCERSYQHHLSNAILGRLSHIGSVYIDFVKLRLKETQPKKENK